MITVQSVQNAAAFEPSHSASTATAPITSSTFGSQLQDAINALTPAPETITSDPVTPAAADASPITQSALSVNAPAATGSAAIKNFIEWQSAQPNPFGQGTMADLWVMQGITDPFNSAALASQAQNELDKSDSRAAFNPSYLAEWRGDWKTQMAQAKAAESARQTLIVAADNGNHVAVGGVVAG